MIRKYKTWYRLLPLIGIGLIVCITTTVNAQSATQTTDRHTAEMGWWKKARFGMFIHWGLYSEAAGYWDGKPISGIGEWIMNDAQVPRHQYEKLATRFDPVDFNAAQWVKIAKEAGIKYLVITTKHHDGFCMFNTRATRYNVVGATPWHKDPMAALSRACSSQGIRFCTYYSVMDWHTKFQQAADTDAIHPTYNPTTLTHPAQYIRYMDHQLHELISQYHTNLIWFDGGWIKNWTSADALHVFKYIRSIDPTVIVNNRLGHHIGDYGTPEQQIPVQGLPGPWETCMTINDTWGYKRGDTSWKSASTLITNLIHCASGGGNFLLNVGPTGKGVIPKPEVDRLLAIGRWLKVNGKAIYGSHRTPFPAELSFGYATQKPGELFLEVTKWPANRELTVPMKNPILHAYLLANPHKELKTIQTPGGLNIQLPLTAPDEVASVVVLKIRGAVQGE
ncbi:MAG TPA: alpha-L-fucosidase [Chitinophagaceae bacterium]|nr:alpha-L-fucosidase [Chitinophagaceae bacterium]